MNNDKNTDRMLGKKLDSYEVKPGKLMFDAVRKNYLAEKKQRTKKRFIRIFFALSAIATLITLTLFLTPKNTNTATSHTAPAADTDPVTHTIQTNPSSVTEKSSSLNETINGSADNNGKYTDKETALPESANSVEGAKENETSNTTNNNKTTDIKLQNENIKTGITEKNTAAENKGLIPPVIKKTEAKNTGDKKETPATNQVTKTFRTPGVEGTQETASKNNLNYNAESKPQVSSTSKLNANTKSNAVIKNNPAQETRPGDNKSEKPQNTIISNDGNNINGDKTSGDPGKQLLLAADKKNNKTDGPADNSKTKTEEEIQNKTAAETNNPLPGNNKTEEPSNEEQAGQPGETQSTDNNTTTADNNPGGIDPKEPVTKPADKPATVAATEKTAPVASTPTPASVPSKKTTGFVISTEVLLNTIDPAISSGSSSDYAKLFSGTHNATRNKVFSGAALLGYKYKNIGFNSGIGMLTVETPVDSRALSKTITSHTMSINIRTRDSVITIYNDTIPVGTVTVVLTKVDTTYGPSGTRTYVVINGDTVKPQTYISSVRFITIPLQLNYSFNLFKGKLVIEPQVGIQIGIPVKTYQFVSKNPYDIGYSKTQKPVKPRFSFYDVSLKVNYRFGRNAFIYLKQGYFFNSKSIYDESYLLNYSLKNLYTAFGVSVLIN